MQRVVISAFGGPEQMVPETVDMPQPGAGEVLIRVAGAGLNGPDLLQRRGLYVPTPDNAQRPGLEVSGVVEALGPGAARFAVGDRVVALVNGAGYAEYVTVPETQTLPAPPDWPLADAAALPECFFTITQTLIMRAGLQAGMSLLVHGASGGIGATALQIARHLGVRTIASVSSKAKAEYALSLGADHLIAYTHEDFVARTLELTDGRGADRIVDVVGGANLRRNVEAAAPNGTIVQLGFLDGAKGEIILPLLLKKNLTLIGSVLGPQPPEVKGAIARRLEADIWPALISGAIGPQRIGHFALESAGAAHAAMESKDHFGKIVLVTPFGLESR
jgi:NADPH:quinone reductase